MIRKTNKLFGLLILPVFVFTCLVRFEVEISSFNFNSISFLPIIFNAALAALTIIWIIVIQNKWAGLLLLKKNTENINGTKFKLSSRGYRWIMFHNSLEVLFTLALGGFFFWALEETFWIGVFLMVKSAEQLLYLIVNRAKFMTVIGGGYLISTGREVMIFPFKKLKSIDLEHDDVYFIYPSKSRIFDRRFIREEDQKSFMQTLKQESNDYNIRFTNKLKV